MKYTNLRWWLPKFLCLMAAFAFWVYVMNEQNPLVENSYTVPVEVRNLDRSLVALTCRNTIVFLFRKGNWIPARFRKAMVFFYFRYFPMRERSAWSSHFLF
jgi:hypothetical protein